MLSQLILIVPFITFSQYGLIFSNEYEEQLFQNIEKLDIGYGNTQFIPTASLNEVSFHEKVQHFHMICKEIQCSYIFGSINYMRLTKSLLENRKLAVSLNANNDKSISFVRPATLMLSNVHNVPAMASIRNLLWIFLLYTHIIDEHINSALKKIEDDEDLWSINESTVLSIHKAVDRLLEEFLETDQCLTFHGKKLPVGNYQENVLLELFNDNYQMIMNQLENNHKLGFSMNGEEKYSRKVLRLNYLFANINGALDSIPTFKVLYGQESPENIFGYLHQQYQRGSITVPNTILSTQIKSLSIFHSDFIQLMKLMAIRTVWNYLKTVAAISMRNDAAALYLIHRIRKYNGKTLNYLNDFAVFFSLTDDPEIKKVLRILEQPIEILNCGRINDKEDIANAINDVTSNLSFKEIMKPVVMEEEKKQIIKDQEEMLKSELTLEDIRILIKTNIAYLNIFVNDAKEAFEGCFNMDVIRSFSEIRNSHTYERLSQLE